MEWRAFGRVVGLTAAVITSLPAAGATQQADKPTVTFRSSVDLVQVAAAVRDKKGRFVPGLTERDFEVLDHGTPQKIVAFHPDISELSIALLFDISGSMEANLGFARETAMHLLSWLNPLNDEAAVFTFDTRLSEAAPFTQGLKALPESLMTVRPFGATSLHDAIAETAKRAAAREGRHRAVVVLTDGNDNASRLSPMEVSTIASSIDVPIYILGVVPDIDNPTADLSATGGRSSLAGPLTELAEWTGGRVLVVSTPAARSAAARQILDELRHEYLIAIESSGNPGWHPLVVRTRDKDLVVRARNGYIAGQSRPNSD
jgi:Ca-activated chloride channel family protein